MDAANEEPVLRSESALPRPHPRWWRRRWFKIVVSLAIVGCIAFVVAAEYVIHNAEPILRKRVVETLSAHFHSPVELDHLDISLVKGIEVEGDGLRVQYLAGANQSDNTSNPPMLSVDHFAFRTRLRGLLHQPTRIAAVDVHGMELHIPPAGDRGHMFGSHDKNHQHRIALLVSEIRCNNVKLFIETNKPGKDPLEFDIQNLDLHDVGQSQPFTYTAELINPKPIGEIHATGHFGPWDSDEPRETPLDGSYSFSHADLNTINGISGMLSSQGQFGGVLDHILIDGETNTPNFSLDVSDHPMPLHTVFHAYVDGTTGDTYLDPVRARLLHSDFTAQGTVVQVKGAGHDIALDVDVPHARMQDLLQLGVKTDPPLMNGVLTMKAKLHIPPGSARVSQKIQLSGSVQLRDVRFNNPSFQDKVDGLSARAQGNPKQVADVSTDREAEVNSKMSAKFSLGHGLMAVNDLHYQIPGALVLMNGVYSLDGNIFEFKGHVRTDATASQMVTGWKSWLLKPVDPFLKKDGAGLELPISISGTQGDVHFGLALHGTANETSKQMTEDLHENRHEMLAVAKEKREEKRAEQENARASVSTDGKQARAERKAQKEKQKAEKEKHKAERHAAAAKANQPNHQPQ
jgi:hypothetical protein